MLTLTGLRPQELIALKWINLNLDNGVLSVEKASKRVVNFGDDGKVVSRGAKIGKPKTPKSDRTYYDLPESLIEALREWRGYCKANDISSEFVFPSTQSSTKGKMRSYTGLRSLLERFLKSHGLENEGITLYTFRRTFATVMTELGNSDTLTADLMGTSPAVLHKHYNVVYKPVHVKAAKAMNDAFVGLTKENPSGCE